MAKAVKGDIATNNAEPTAVATNPPGRNSTTSTKNVAGAEISEALAGETAVKNKVKYSIFFIRKIQAVFSDGDFKTEVQHLDINE